MTEARAPRIDWWRIAGGKTLLERPRFSRMLLARLLALIGQNALLYAMLVLLVENTGSSISTGVFLLSFAIPAAALGPVSGVVIDRFPRSLLLAAMNILRVFICVGLLISGDSAWTLYLFALALSATMQFVGPAESASLPQLVEQGEITQAGSLFNLTSLIGQAAGLGILAPIALNTIGADPLFVVSGALFAVAAVAIATVPGLGMPSAMSTARIHTPGVRNEFARAWQALQRDEQAYLATVMQIVGNLSLLVAVALLPRFAEDELNISVTNMVFVFWPAVIGIFVGLRLAGWISRVIGQGHAMTLGFVLLVLSLVAFGLVGDLAGLLERVNILGISDPGPIYGRGARVVIAMVTSVFAGFAYSLVGVVGRAIINERIPLEMQGRVFAAVNVLTNLSSVIPLLVAGALADLLGVRPVILMVCVLVSAFIVWFVLRERTVRPLRGGLHG